MAVALIAALAVSHPPVDSRCASVRAARELAQQEGLDDRTLAVLEGRSCAATAHAGADCAALTTMLRLARLGEAPADTLATIERQRTLSCTLGDQARLDWPNGVTAKYASGAWNYPNGVTARYDSGGWNYSNGVTARYASGGWNYPNGVTAKYASGGWNRPNGASSSPRDLLERVCARDEERCRWFASSVAARSGDEQDVALLELAWSLRR